MNLPRMSLFKPKAIKPSLAQQLANAMRADRRRTFLFVDDDMMYLEMVSSVASKFDLEALCAPTLREARDILFDRQKVDAIILDSILTNGEGVELYRELKKNGSKTQVVFLTGHNDESLRKKVEAIGPAPVFSKNAASQMEFLSELIEQLGAKRISTTPHRLFVISSIPKLTASA